MSSNDAIQFSGQSIGISFSSSADLSFKNLSPFMKTVSFTWNQNRTLHWNDTPNDDNLLGSNYEWRTHFVGSEIPGYFDGVQDHP